MVTLLGLKSTTLDLLHTIASHDTQCYPQTAHENSVDERQEPLISSVDNKQNINTFDNYWEFLCMNNMNNRLDFLLKHIFTSLNIPYEIWNVILQFELMHPIHDIISAYLLSIKQSLHHIYIIPYVLGSIQFIIVGFILSGFYDVIIHHILPQQFNFYLRVSGAILLFTSTLQIIFCLYSVHLNYNSTYIIQLSKLKQAFYQKKKPQLLEEVSSTASLSISIAKYSAPHPDDNNINDDIDEDRLTLLLLEHCKINTVECQIQYAHNNKYIEWQMAWHPRNNNNITLTALQPWELLISAQKWCNVLYVQNVLYFCKNHVMHRLDTDVSALRHPNIWFILCKPIFIFLVGAQLVTLSSCMVLLWIPYCTLLCYLVWRCVFNVGFYASLCWSLIVCCLEFWEVSSTTNWMHSSLDAAKLSAIAAFQEIFILIAAYSLVFLCQKTHKILLCGVWPAWILAYALIAVEPYVNKDKDKYIGSIFNLLSLYCVYLSTQFILFCIPKQQHLKLFSTTKFIMCSWLFGWLDVQSFAHLYHDPRRDLLAC